jgi:hypothetical protein
MVPEAKAIWLTEKSPLKRAANRREISASFTRLFSFSRRDLSHGNRFHSTAIPFHFTFNF